MMSDFSEPSHIPDPIKRMTLALPALANKKADSTKREKKVKKRTFSKKNSTA